MTETTLLELLARLDAYGHEHHYPEIRLNPGRIPTGLPAWQQWVDSHVCRWYAGDHRADAGLQRAAHAINATAVAA